jgi:hypothetical protein
MVSPEGLGATLMKRALALNRVSIIHLIFLFLSMKTGELINDMIQP